MVATYSPHRESGGTLHLPSPTHIHHVDPTSALSQLRRSLSRSPSKGPTFRLVMSKSTSPSPSSPLSASPLSPQKRSESANTQSQTGFALPSSLAVHLPASTKKNRSNARKLSPMRNSSRSSSSHRSPMKRALSDSTNSGNATPPSSGDFNPGIENRSPSPDDTMVMDTSSGLFSSQYNDPSILNPTLARFEKSNGSHGGFSAKSSPLKRSDGTMNLDQAFLGSPSAKRRSLHGAPFGPDFNIFDHEAVVSTQPEPRRSTDGPAYPESNTFELPSLQSPMPKRTSSLRKTTLQQRWEKPSLFKLRPNVDLAVEFATPSQQAPSKGRHRMSLENFLPAMGRESPFSSQGSLLNASVHPMTTQRKESQDTGVQGRASRHPLSRTITQSSSSSSMAEDSPTHVPFRQPEHKRKSLDFSKSLPVGAGRPFQRAPLSHEISNQTSSTETSFATPENYKLAKPLPAAFMSTGLISKRNKIIDDGPSGMHAITTNMPDTPCKRPNGMTSVSPIPAPDSAAGKARLRHSMHSFGTPSTPFNPHPTRPTSGMFGKSVSIFGSKFASGSVPRRGSFVSNEGDENSQSPPTKGDSQSSTDCELPRTPTKSALGPSGMQSGDGISGRKSLLSPEAASRYGAIGAQPSRLEQSCKSSPKGTLRRSVDGDSDSMVEDSPSACLRSRHITSISSQSTRPYLFRISTSPTPLPKKPHTVHSLNLKKEKTKRSPLSPASPINDQFPPMSPHTPQEGILPPDPSGLSISGHRGGLVRQPSNTFNNSFSSSVSAAPPVTPTSKDYFSQFGKRRSSITPVHNASVTDVDLSLISRFDKVEPIGTGEFSQVFRVSQKADQNSVHGSTNVRPSPKLPMPDRVWAVKKSRHPYIGARDRKKKLQEVEVLRMLGQSDHIVQLVDSWENKDHLYIQTEFCEEGSLDVFLDQVGRKARLDDFRIWKILLELSLVSPLKTLFTYTADQDARA